LSSISRKHTITAHQSTGAAYVGARSGICCQPGGVYFSISVDKQIWSLANSLNVESSGSILTSGSYTVNNNTWYNISLSVVGTTVNAWIGSDQVCSDWLRCSQSCPLQVVNGYTLSSVTAGWAAIGTSVQSNNVYTYAQFDNFQVYGNRLQCPTPFAGNQLSTNVWCGGESHWRVCWRC
jgi:hypothetical protein